MFTRLLCWSRSCTSGIDPGWTGNSGNGQPQTNITTRGADGRQPIGPVYWLTNAQGVKAAGRGIPDGGPIGGSRSERAREGPEGLDRRPVAQDHARCPLGAITTRPNTHMNAHWDHPGMGPPACYCWSVEEGGWGQMGRGGCGEEGLGTGHRRPCTHTRDGPTRWPPRTPAPAAAGQRGGRPACPAGRRRGAGGSADPVAP